MYLHLLARSCSLTDAGLMEVPWGLDVGFMEVLKARVSTLADAGLIDDTWRIDVGFIEILKARHRQFQVFI